MSPLFAKMVGFHENGQGNTGLLKTYSYGTIYVYSNGLTIFMCAKTGKKKNRKNKKSHFWRRISNYKIMLTSLAIVTV